MPSSNDGFFVPLLPGASARLVRCTMNSPIPVVPRKRRRRKPAKVVTLQFSGRGAGSRRRVMFDLCPISGGSHSGRPRPTCGTGDANQRGWSGWRESLLGSPLPPFSPRLTAHPACGLEFMGRLYEPRGADSWLTLCDQLTEAEAAVDGAIRDSRMSKATRRPISRVNGQSRSSR